MSFLETTFLDAFQSRIKTLQTNDLKQKNSYLEFLRNNDQEWDEFSPKENQTFSEWKSAYELWVARFGSDKKTLEENLWTYGKTLESEQKAEYLSSGSYGCGVTPPVCGPNKGDPNSFMKVMSIKDADDEKKTTDEILKIKGYEKWAIIASHRCELSSKEKALLPRRCNTEDEKQLSGLTMERAEMMDDWIKKTKTIKDIHARTIEALTFLIHLFQALNKLHRSLGKKGKKGIYHGYAHLDLKMDNVAVSLEDGLPRLIDFGFARKTLNAKIQDMPRHSSYAYWSPEFNVAIMRHFKPNQSVQFEKSYPFESHWDRFADSDQLDFVQFIGKDMKFSPFPEKYKLGTLSPELDLKSVDMFSFGLLAFDLFKRLEIPKNVKNKIPESLFGYIHPDYRNREISSLILGTLRSLVKKESQVHHNSPENRKMYNQLIEDAEQKVNESYDDKREWLMVATNTLYLTPEQNRALERKLYTPQELAIEEIVATANPRILKQFEIMANRKGYQYLSTEEIWKLAPVYEIGFLNTAVFIDNMKSIHDEDWVRNEREKFIEDVFNHTKTLIKAVKPKMSKKNKVDLLEKIEQMDIFIIDQYGETPEMDAIRNLLGLK